MKKLTLARFTKLLLDFSFGAGIVVLVLLPFAIRFYSGYNSYFARFWWQLWILFALAGIFVLLIIAELRKIFKTVLADDCFVYANVTSLQRMGTYAFCISFISFFRLLLYITPAIIVIIATFFLAGLFSKVLAQVFEKAVSYKLENDLTI